MDRALADALVGEGIHCTRSQLEPVFAAGLVTAGGRALKPSWVVDAPREIELVLPTPEPLRARPEAIALDVAHEDDDVLVVDKPAGMVVHAGPGHASGTLVNAVLHHLGVGPEDLPVLPGNEPTRPGIVHRIDRDTSGLLVVAKHARAQEHLAAQLRTHDVERTYLGIVVGEPTWRERRVETLHGRDPRDRRRFSPDVAHGRTAVTHMAVRESLRGATLLEFRLETGRTHQIRMHARHVGHAILADAVYGRRVADSFVRDAAAALGRQALHAATLCFRHPADDRPIRLSAPLPADMAAALAMLARTR